MVSRTQTHTHTHTHQAGCGRWGSYSQGMPTASPCRPQAPVPDGMYKSATSGRVWLCRPRQRMLPRLRKDRKKPRVHPRGRRTNKQNKTNHTHTHTHTHTHICIYIEYHIMLAWSSSVQLLLPAYRRHNRMRLFVFQVVCGYRWTSTLLAVGITPGVSHQRRVAF